jgi:hypothetical protein
MLPQMNEFINKNLPKLVIDKSIDEVVTFLVALVQYIQLRGYYILENKLVNDVYKSKRLYKNIDDFECKHIDEIVDFFKKCEELYDDKISKAESTYIVKRINYLLQLMVRKFILFPCNDDKTPHARQWNKLKFKDTVQLFLEQEIIFTNIGVVCGKDSGMVVVDVDTKDHGMEYWSEMLKDHNNGEDIDTLMTITGSLGRHYYFKYTDNMESWFSTNKMFTKEKVIGAKIEGNINEALLKYNKIGIDFRSRNGFVIVPPSIHLKCKSLYEFNDISKPLSNMPVWLFDIVDDYFIKRAERLAQMVKEDKVLLNDHIKNEDQIVKDQLIKV